MGEVQRVANLGDQREHLLDENVPEAQRLLVRSWRIPVRQIGLDVATKGDLGLGEIGYRADRDQQNKDDLRLRSWLGTRRGWLPRCGHVDRDRLVGKHRPQL